MIKKKTNNQTPKVNVIIERVPMVGMVYLRLITDLPETQLGNKHLIIAYDYAGNIL